MRLQPRDWHDNEMPLLEFAQAAIFYPCIFATLSGAELKYRMTFAEFAEAWEQGAIAGRWSHAVERDYMEWEGLEEERRQWLARLRALQIKW